MPWTPERWAGPRLAAYAPLIARLTRWSSWPSVAELDRLLADRLRAPGAPAVALVEQAAPPRRRPRQVEAGAMYEVRAASGLVPTRPRNHHDLWNALVWATFPRSKQALTARLAALQVARAGGARLPGSRTPAHDRLALLDEGGLIVAAHDGRATAVVFGHAILEHAARGELAVRAAPLTVACPLVGDLDRRLAALDDALAHALAGGAEVAPGPGVIIDDAALCA
jgi:Protein of unknown function (DUF3025)